MKGKNYIYGLLSVFILFFVVFAPGQAGAAVCGGTPCVDSADIIDGSVTRADSVPLEHVIVVAESGGDFTSIQAAISSVTPTANDPYVIKVMPGTYIELVTMKSFMHLQGSGAEVTTIEAPTDTSSSYTIDINDLENVQVSGFTVRGGWYGIKTYSTTVLTIINNIITDNKAAGIYNYFSEFAVIMENIVTANGGSGILDNNSIKTMISNNMVTTNGYNGIDIGASSSYVIGNVIEGNSASGIFGHIADREPVIKGNVIQNNKNGIGVSMSGTAHVVITGNTISNSQFKGLFVATSNCPGKAMIVTHNKITGSASRDVEINVLGCTINVSYNIYDTVNNINGAGVGMYNLKTDGTPALAL
ncbi:hypothetical protein MNBD_DELTA01-913 [hydrothermal vent metagenome]|uniref:Carbohydrate-binding/sugar hydrolysis domain-containing protein n=1 Tax=hydrothermal vent metagenome TaxID=652676 RepID=A0A3B0RCV8_9ZZZZ